jgi:hypothetical protein
MPQIQAPDGQTIQFPDSMKDQDIEAAMGRLYPKPVPGMEKLSPNSQPPPAGARPPAPAGMRDQPDNFFTSPNGLIRTGARQLGEVLPNLAAGRKAEAISNTLEGGGKMLAPVGIGAGLVNPVAALGSMAGGLAGSEGGKAIARHFQASPETERAIGDVSAIPGGMIGGGIGKMLQPKLSTIRALATDPTVQDAAIGAIPGIGRGLLKVRNAIRTSAANSQPEEEPGFIAPSREAVNPVNEPEPLVVPPRVTPQRALPPGGIVPSPPADNTSVRVTTGEPLSYPGPRQLTAPQPGPTQNLRPPARLGPGPIIGGPAAEANPVTITRGEPLSYPGPRLLPPPGTGEAPRLVKPENPIPVAYRSKSTSGLQIPEESMARDRIATEAASHLYRNGIKPDQIRTLDPQAQKLFWDTLSQKEGLSTQPHYSMSKATQDATMGKLVEMSRGRAEAPPAPIGGQLIPAHLANNPRALAAAQALQKGLIQ